MKPRSLCGLLLLALLFTGYASKPRELRLPRGMKPGDPVMGVYRARIEPSGGRPRRFRMLLFAQQPDRIHAEALSPVGTTEMILDAGDGLAAVTLVRDGVAYVGPLEPGIVEATLGLPIAIEELVRGILGPQPPRLEGRTILREPEGREGLPRRLEAASEQVRLTLELKRLQPVRGLAEELGRGTPPPGMERRPLSELGSVELPGEEEEER